MKDVSSVKECRDIFSAIKKRYPKLSKSHKLIADFMLSHYENAAEMSAVSVAKSVGVSEATVVRFSVTLGYEGYPEFRRAIKNEINSKLTDAKAAIARVRAVFEKDAVLVDETDGISLEFSDWRFNLRSSNTEPLVRLNVESRADVALMQEKTAQILALLRQ